MLCEGADIIELICVQYLRALGLQNSAMPTFNHSTPRGRLLTWYNSVFDSRIGRQISGDHLIRQATSMVSQLHKSVKTASKVSLPYWSLEELMRGGVINPIKRPHAKSASWEALASHSPPLILAVGSIPKTLISTKGEAVFRPAAKGHIRLFRRFTGSESSGIITDLERMRICSIELNSSRIRPFVALKIPFNLGLTKMTTTSS